MKEGVPIAVQRPQVTRPPAGYLPENRIPFHIQVHVLLLVLMCTYKPNSLSISVPQILFDECWGETQDDDAAGLQTFCPVRPWTFTGPGLPLMLGIFQVRTGFCRGTYLL